MDGSFQLQLALSMEPYPDKNTVFEGRIIVLEGRTFALHATDVGLIPTHIFPKHH